MSGPSRCGGQLAAVGHKVSFTTGSFVDMAARGRWDHAFKPPFVHLKLVTVEPCTSISAGAGEQHVLLTELELPGGDLDAFCWQAKPGRTVTFRT